MLLSVSRTPPPPPLPISSLFLLLSHFLLLSTFLAALWLLLGLLSKTNALDR